MSLIGRGEVRLSEVAGDARPASKSFNPDARVERPQGDVKAARTVETFSPDKRVEVYHGGSYRDVFMSGGEREAHHIPAKEVNGLKTADGPCISMDKEDHRETASCGMTKEAREYRGLQRELIERGEFKAALKMDIDDLRQKFGEKYDDALHEAADYAERMGFISDQEGLWDDAVER